MPEPDPRTVAIAAAREAGALARAAFRGRREITSKGGQDIVTEIDHAAEAAICARLAAAFPADAILAEERGSQGGRARYCWVIDPLDGTHNYAAQLPFWCLSIARYDQEAGRPEVGVIYDPLHDELFAAGRGGGAMLNGTPLRVGQVADVRAALLACDVGYEQAISNRMMRAARGVQPRTRRLRILGSAVLALAYVAAGRIDAFFHLHLQPWDLAAAWLLVEEAGGVITTWEGAPLTLTAPGVVAANPALHPQVLALLDEVAGGE
jgi:myo-inositol-1(or 4)-monophosphatase